MLKSQLDQYLRTVLKRKSEGDIGIELEIEGSYVHAHYQNNNKFWMSKEEGSLRHGVEYVCQRPIYMKELDDALIELKGYMTAPNVVLKPSIRCSTHMHINVLDKTVKQIYAIMAYYYMIEDILVTTQGPVRTGNLFCLRLSDAEGLSESIKHSIKDEMFFKAFNLNHHKYAALNLASPGRFGSLEFRFLRPILDIDLMRKWAWLFYNMVENSSAYSLKQVIEAASSKSVMEYLQMVFNKDQMSMIVDGRSVWDLQEMFTKNYDHVSKMAYLLSKKTRFFIPDEFLDDDLAGSPYRAGQMKYTIDPSLIAEMAEPEEEPDWMPDDDEMPIGN